MPIGSDFGAGPFAQRRRSSFDQKQFDLRYGQQTPFWDQPAIDPGDGEAIFAHASGIWNGIPLTTEPMPYEFSPWDFIVLNGERAPGICRLEGGRHVGLDIKKAIGQLLPEITVLNFDPVPFTLILTLWHPDHLTQLKRLLKKILPTPGPNPKVRAVRAEYPALDLIGVQNIFFQSMELPRHIGNQIMEVSFQCFEWNPDLHLDPRDADSPEPQAGMASKATVVPPSQIGMIP